MESQIDTFQFVDGWQYPSDDLRDMQFTSPVRLEDNVTWVVGVHFGIKDGGPHGLWNRGTFVVKFAGYDSCEVLEVGIYIRNRESVHVLEPGKSLRKLDGEAPVALL